MFASAHENLSSTRDSLSGSTRNFRYPCRAERGDAALAAVPVPETPMTDPQVRLLDLLERWQSLERQGRPATAAEVCADCPELAGELEQFARFVRRVEGLSTASGAMDTDGPAIMPTLAPADEPARPMVTTPAEERYAIEDQLGEGGMGAV